MATPLSQDEIEACREAFTAFALDREGAGGAVRIDAGDLPAVLEAMGGGGAKPSDEEMCTMLAEVDTGMRGALGERKGSGAVVWGVEGRLWVVAVG